MKQNTKTGEKMFIELTQLIYSYDGKTTERKIYLNINSITAILHPSEEKDTATVFCGESLYVVKETYEKIKSLVIIKF